MSLVRLGYTALCWIGAAAGSAGQSVPNYTVFSARTSVTPAVTSTAVRQPQPRITLQFKNTPIPEALHRVIAQAGLALMWSETKVPLKGTVSATLHNVSVTEALQIILKGTGTEANLSSDGQTIVIVRADRKGANQDTAQGVVTGRIIDSASGQGLGGVSVKVISTGLTATTTDSGAFTLRNVPAGDQTIAFRVFGYRSVERTVHVTEHQRTFVRVVMPALPTVLSGVVTTATGKQRRVEVGNDITVLNADSILKVAPVTSVTQMLATRVPGLTVQTTSGVPGDPSRVRIRGVSSVTGNNDPIVIVDGIRVYSNQSDPRNDNLAMSAYAPDGVAGHGSGNLVGGVSAPSGYAAPSPLDQIDPNSIETIEVFKGPSASAMYGSDAANGVIVITTKHGRAGPTHWNLSLGQGVNWLPGKWPINYYRFGKTRAEFNGLSFSAVANALNLCSLYDPYCAVDSVVAFQALNDDRFSVFTHGSDQTGQVTISGGVPTLQYSLTGSAAEDIGNLKLDQYDQQHYAVAYGPVPGWMKRPDNYQNYGISGQVTARPGTPFSVTLLSSLFNSAQQQGSLQQAIGQIQGVYVNTISDTLRLQNSPSTNGTQSLVQNYVERAMEHTITANNALTLQWQMTHGVAVNMTAGLNTIQRTGETYVPYGVNPTGISADGVTQSDTTGSYGFGSGTSENKSLTVGVTVPVNVLTIAVGGNVVNQSTRDFSAYTSQLSPGVSEPSNFIYTAGNGPTQTTSASSTYGWYFEPRFNFSSRFFISPGFRLDGGSASGSHAGLTGYPKIDLSYLVIDPDHPYGWVSLFRPRLAFGVAGTQPAPLQKLRLFNQGGGQVVQLSASMTLPEVRLSTLGNTTLRPETSHELEGGLDLSFWDGRLSTTWTAANKTTFHTIIPIQVAPSVYGGLSSQYVNVGEVRNLAFEATVDATVLEGRSASWSIGANLSSLRNKVVHLDPGFAPNRVLGIVPGYPLFSDWARPIIGVSDINQDNVIEGNEYKVGDSAIYIGSTYPRYQLNLNTTLTLFHGRLSATANFAYQNGQTQNNLGALQSNSVALLANAPGTSLGTQAALLAAYCSALPFGSGYRTAWLQGCAPTPVGVMQTVNTFRFNTLSVNYTLPVLITRWLHVPHASLAVQGSNLGLHTNYRGFDPNVNAFSTVNSGDQTADLGQLPQPRIWWLKLNLGN